MNPYEIPGVPNMAKYNAESGLELERQYADLLARHRASDVSLGELETVRVLFLALYANLRNNHISVTDDETLQRCYDGPKPDAGYLSKSFEMAWAVLNKTALGLMSLAYREGASSAGASFIPGTIVPKPVIRAEIGIRHINPDFRYIGLICSRDMADTVAQFGDIIKDDNNDESYHLTVDARYNMGEVIDYICALAAGNAGV